MDSFDNQGQPRPGQTTEQPSGQEPAPAQSVLYCRDTRPSYSRSWGHTTDPNQAWDNWWAAIRSYETAGITCRSITLASRTTSQAGREPDDKDYVLQSEELNGGEGYLDFMSTLPREALCQCRQAHHKAYVLWHSPRMGSPSGPFYYCSEQCLEEYMMGFGDDAFDWQRTGRTSQTRADKAAATTNPLRANS